MRILPSLLLTLVVLFPVSSASAGLVGFESGIPAGWSLAGSGGTSGAVSNLSPTEGTAFGFIDTLGVVDTTFTGVNSATAGSILLSSPFTVGAGDTLSLDLNFLTQDGGLVTDFALVQLLSAGTPVATLFSAQTKGPGANVVPGADAALALSAGVTLTPATVADFDGIATGPLGGITYGPFAAGGGPGGSTDWVNSSYVPGAGLYQLRFIVSDTGDTRVNSALAIDNITGITVPVPEPGSLSLFACGGLALVFFNRRRSVR